MEPWRRERKLFKATPDAQWRDHIETVATDGKGGEGVARVPVDRVDPR
jgi:hypothetical protein